MSTSTRRKRTGRAHGRYDTHKPKITQLHTGRLYPAAVEGDDATGYRARVYHPTTRRRHHSATFPDPAAALAWATTEQAGLDRRYLAAGNELANNGGAGGGRSRAGTPTFAAYAQQWLDTSHYPVGTRANYQSKITRAVAWFGADTLISEPDPAAIRAFMTHLRTAPSAANGRPAAKAATRNIYLAVLSHVFGAAIDDKHRADDPTRRITERDTGDEPPPRKQVLTTAQLNALRVAMPPSLAAGIDLGYEAGLRLSEIIGLKADSVNPLHRTMLIVDSIDSRGNRRGYTKGGKRDTTPMPITRALADALTTHLATHPAAPTGELLTHPRTGEALTQGQFRYFYGKAWAAAGQDGAPPRVHDLRFSAGSHMQAAGVPQEATQTFMRHENSNTTRLAYYAPAERMRQLAGWIEARDTAAGAGVDNAGSGEAAAV